MFSCEITKLLTLTRKCLYILFENITLLESVRVSIDDIATMMTTPKTTRYTQVGVSCFKVMGRTYAMSCDG